MFRRVVGSVVLAAVLAAALYAYFTPWSRTAEATLPAGCPAAPGVGAVDYVVIAVLPAGAGANANGVCINLIGTGGTNNSGVVLSNPAGCAAPAAGAGSSYVWADWGVSNCVAPGQRVKIAFKGGGSLQQGVQNGAATWSLAGGGTFTSAVIVQGSAALSVGGVAESPDLNQLAAAGQGGDSSVLPYAAGGGAAGALALVAVVAGAWFVRRRSRVTR